MSTTTAFRFRHPIRRGLSPSGGTLSSVLDSERCVVEWFEDLWRSLEASPGIPALIVGDGADDLLRQLAEWRGTSPTSVGALLAKPDERAWRRPDRALRGSQFLDDIEILFWPDVPVDPLRLLRALSRRHPVVVKWPGEVNGSQALFSEPGRPDYYAERLQGEVLLRSRPITFPTDRPYDLEIVR